MFAERKLTSREGLFSECMREVKWLPLNVNIKDKGGGLKSTSLEGGGLQDCLAFLEE